MPIIDQPETVSFQFKDFDGDNFTIEVERDEKTLAFTNVSGTLVLCLSFADLDELQAKVGALSGAGKLSPTSKPKKK